ATRASGCPRVQPPLSPRLERVTHADDTSAVPAHPERRSGSERGRTTARLALWPHSYTSSQVAEAGMCPRNQKPGPEHAAGAPAPVACAHPTELGPEAGPSGPFALCHRGWLAASSPG